MKIPVTFKVDTINRSDLLLWLCTSESAQHTVYDSVRKLLTFEHENDAIVFSLTFGLQRYETLIEQKLKYEENHD